MTTMYFKNRWGDVLVHHFDFEKDSGDAKSFLNRGYTFENPDKALPVSTEFICDVCGRECKSNLGLISHKRSHSEKGNTTEV